MTDSAEDTGAPSPWREDSGFPRAGAAPLEGRRADAGRIRLTGRDVAGLLWCGEMYGVRADLLGDLLGVNAAAVRQLHMRWRRAGVAETASLGPGPVWCWLTRTGLEVAGLPYEPRPPALARIAHVHAVGVVRRALEGWDSYAAAGAFWRSERELRWRLGAGVGRVGHVPDGEVCWPDGGGRNEGQVWCVEVELTAKTAARTASIMSALLGRAAGYGAEDGGGEAESGLPRYARLLYVVSAAARATVERARATLPQQATARVEVRNLPAGALP